MCYVKVMSTPLRVNDSLFKEAEVEGSFMNRSTAKQVEFWAELGRRVAQSVSPADMLALMQGIANVRVELPESQPINPEQVFTAVEEANSSYQLGNKVTRGRLFYEASKSRPGLIDRVKPDGTRQTGHFKNGSFIAE